MDLDVKTKHGLTSKHYNRWLYLFFVEIPNRAFDIMHMRFAVVIGNNYHFHQTTKRLFARQAVHSIHVTGDCSVR